MPPTEELPAPNTLPATPQTVPKPTTTPNNGKTTEKSSALPTPGPEIGSTLPSPR
jgi:hypothetical protein